METTTTTPPPVVLRADAIRALPLVPLASSVKGVTQRILRQTASSVAGVMTVEAGHQLGRHSHRTNHHHIWVLEGEAQILDVTVGPGSYVYVPSGVDHDLDARATSRRTIFYLYLPPPD